MSAALQSAPGIDAQTIADAAMAASDGDLAPAAALLTSAGARVAWYSPGELHWSEAPGVPVAGLTIGGDPVSPCVVLLFALVGPGWGRHPLGRALALTNRMWGERTRAAKAARQ